VRTVDISPSMPIGFDGVSLLEATFVWQATCTLVFIEFPLLFLIQISFVEDGKRKRVLTRTYRFASAFTKVATDDFAYARTFAFVFVSQMFIFDGADDAEDDVDIMKRSPPLQK